MPRSVAAGAACLLLLGLIGASCSPSPGPANETSRATADEAGLAPPSNQVDTGFSRLIEKWTTGQARTLPGRRPDHYFGDFNGDGNQDAVVPIQFTVKGASRSLSGVRVLNPWLVSVEPGTTDVHATDSDKALLVLHGSTTAWDGSAPMTAVVLLDSVYEELRVVTRAAKDSKLPSIAKGDCLLTGTEDARGIICWNGTTYLWEQRGD